MRAVKFILQKEECPLDYAAAAAHFHVQGCIQCFKELLKAIMGIQVVELPLEPGQLLPAVLNIPSTP